MTTVADEQARAALGLVFEGVSAMRADSPLTALGMSASDCVCVSDAVESVCGARLLDGEFVSIVTVQDLADAIRARSAMSVTP